MTNKRILLERYQSYRATITNAQELSKKILQAKHADIDFDKDRRLEEQKCILCFYFRNSRAGGDTITIEPCAICIEEQTYTSTAIDRLCKKCAERNELCKQCGADIELRQQEQSLAPTLFVPYFS